MPTEEDGFEEFWKLYPRKVAKSEARKAWIQTTKIRPPIAKLLKALYAARASKAWLKDDGEFIPHASTYLRGERWDDEHEVDLSRLSTPAGRACAYCGKTATSCVNGLWSCDAHSLDAMDGKKPKVVSIGGKPDDVVDMKLASAGKD